MINKKDYITVYGFRDLCTYDCVIQGINNLPNSGILWAPNDLIKPLFEIINNLSLNNRYLLIGTSDFGLHYQQEYPVNRDILKAISRIDFEKDYFGSDKYLTLHITPQCVPEQCLITDKYSLRCYHYTHATFDKIPPQVSWWYSANMAVDEPQCENIPLGLLNNNYQFNFTPHTKKKLCYINFSDITVERLELKRKLSRPQFNEWCTFKDKIPFEEYCKDLEDHLFVICAEGNGRDAFRVYESIYSGCICIMELNRWSKQFNGLPVLYVKSLFDVSKDMLESAAKELPNNKFNLEHTTYTYWKERILQKWQKAQKTV